MTERPEQSGIAYFTVKGDRFDFPAEMTGRELQFVKLETGLRAGEIEEAVGAGDVEVLLTLCVIAMRRAGKEDASLDDLLDLSIGAEDGLDFFSQEDDTAARPTEAASDEPTPPKPSAAKRGRRTTPASTD